MPLPVDRIGLGPFFDLGFRRAEVGRRQTFREGDPSSVVSAPVFHFEDNDRVRGLTVSASLGLIATKEFEMGRTTSWAVWRNVEFNHAPSPASGSHEQTTGRGMTVVGVTVRAQTNAEGGCGQPTLEFPTADLAPPAVQPKTCGNFTAPGNLNEDHIKALRGVATIDACCEACGSTGGCQCKQSPATVSAALD